jgi:hypothetical protein
MHFGFLIFINDDFIVDKVDFKLMYHIIKQSDCAWSVCGFVKLYEFQYLWWDFLKIQKWLKVVLELLLSKI